MPGGIYSALSGLRSHHHRLDRLATDLANSATSGYKGERNTTSVAPRDSFAAALASAVDVVATAPGSDFRPGELASTGRDLDLAIDGPGFFAIQTPSGTRYTRNGHFTRRADGTLTTSDDYPVLDNGNPIRLPPGEFEIAQDGTISVGRATAGRPSVIVFDDPGKLIRADGVRFAAPDGVTGSPADDSQIRSGVLEKSNVNVMERVAQMAEMSRGYEALTRGVSVLMNDIESRAITELGRR